MTLLDGTLVVGVLCLGTLSLLASNIARRVGRVTWAAERIATGDSTVRSDLPDSRDEVGLMAATFNSRFPRSTFRWERQRRQREARSDG